jgi:hypothetical protein
MYELQIHEVVRAPVVLWHHMVYVGFLAIFQVLVTLRTEPLLPLKELTISRRRGLGFRPSLSPIVLEGRIIWGRGRGGSVSKVEMANPMTLIYKVLFPSISTFETPPTP